MKSLRNRFALAAFVFGMLTYFIPFIVDESTLADIVVEDGPLENITAVCFLLAAVCFLMTFFISKTRNEIGPIKTSRNIIFLGLAVILFFGAGEELSWGQRIFNYETPESIKEQNVHEELTLHNLEMFDTASGGLITMNRLFILFWFGFAIVPHATAWASKAMRESLIRWGVPLVPLLLGGQFLLYYLLSKTWKPLIELEDSVADRITEIRETQHAVIFFVIALYLYLEARKQPIEEVAK